MKRESPTKQEMVEEELKRYAADTGKTWQEFLETPLADFPGATSRIANQVSAHTCCSAVDVHRIKTKLRHDIHVAEMHSRHQIKPKSKGNPNLIREIVYNLWRAGHRSYEALQQQLQKRQIKSSQQYVRILIHDCKLRDKYPTAEPPVGQNLQELVKCWIRNYPKLSASALHEKMFAGGIYVSSTEVYNARQAIKKETELKSGSLSIDDCIQIRKLIERLGYEQVRKTVEVFGDIFNK